MRRAACLATASTTGKATTAAPRGFRVRRNCLRYPLPSDVHVRCALPGLRP